MPISVNEQEHNSRRAGLRVPDGRSIKSQMGPKTNEQVQNQESACGTAIPTTTQDKVLTFTPPEQLRVQRESAPSEVIENCQSSVSPTGSPEQMDHSKSNTPW